MAEVVGLVVGLASFGAQLLDGTKKLKALCECVKDAPTELKDTIEAVEILSDIVSMMAHPESRPNAESAVLARSMELCQKALDKLVTLTKDLQHHLQTNKVKGVLFVVLKKDSMEHLITRLEQCKGLLQLSHQLYIGAHNMSRLDRQDQALDELHKGQIMLVARSVNQFDCHRRLLGEIHTGQRRLVERSTLAPVIGRAGQDANRRWTDSERGQSKMAIRVRIPGWTISRVLELSVAQVVAGWTAALRCYRVLQDKDPVFAACENNDLVSLQRLFGEKKAGIYDRDQWGCSIFEVAMMFGAVDICKFLYVQGGGILPEHNQEMVVYFFWESFLTTAHFSPNEYGQESGMVKLRQRCTDALAQLGFNRFDPIFQEARLKSLWTPAKNLSASDQLDSMLGVADMIYYSSSIKMSEVLQDMLGQAPLDEALLDPSLSEGKSLLHVFAVAHACLLFYCDFRAPDQNPAFQYAVSCISQCIAVGADLHSRAAWIHNWYDNMTPLAIFVNSIMAPRGSHLDGTLLNKALQSWARLLECSGADLVEYGERESTSRCGYFNFWAPSAKILGLSYAATPEDWHFWFLEPTDDYVGAFWALVEEPDRDVPGAWIEEGEGAAGALDVSPYPRDRSAASE